ncbi:MAG TPA: flagellar hook-associated protein FlgK [Gemmatimonadales bacterium]|jgi:flagellar hook-associated protein 1 FlgK
MAGLSDLLSIATSAMQTQQRALNVTGNNIANTSTPGYTRESLNITEAVPLRTPEGLVGRGVTDTGVIAQRDTFLDAAYRTQQGIFSQADSLNTLVTQVQTLFNEPSDQGIGATLDSFLGAWGDLANDPQSGAARVVVQQDAVQLTQQFHQLDQGLDQVSQSASDQFKSDVGQINSISSQIAELNKQIVAFGGQNDQAAPLQDKRGVLLDQLAGIANTRVLDRADGSVGVIVGDDLVVDEGVSQQLETRTKSDGTLGVGVVGDTKFVEIDSGSLAGFSDVINKSVAQVRTSLDTLVAAMVQTINSLHESGKTTANTTGTDFFDPAGLTAASVNLAAPIAASASNIVTGATSADGDNSVALQIAALRTTGVAALGGTTLGDNYTSIVTGVGTMVSTATQQSAAAKVISDGLQAQRSSETGVSTNDEMIALITQQQAFTAAAHIVTVADDLMQEVLKMV